MVLLYNPHYSFAGGFALHVVSIVYLKNCGSFFNSFFTSTMFFGILPSNSAFMKVCLLKTHFLNSVVISFFSSFFTNKLNLLYYYQSWIIRSSFCQLSQKCRLSAKSSKSSYVPFAVLALAFSHQRLKCTTSITLSSSLTPPFINKLILAWITEQDLFDLPIPWGCVY